MLSATLAPNADNYIFRLWTSILPISNIKIHLCTTERERELDMLPKAYPRGEEILNSTLLS